MKLTPIPADKVDTVWTWCAPLVDKSCSHAPGGMTAQDIYEAVKDGRGFILATIDDNTAIVMERCDHCLHVVSIGGHGIVGRIGEFLDALYIVAGYIGAKGISYKGRKGWGRLLAPFGFRETQSGFMEVRI